MFSILCEKVLTSFLVAVGSIHPQFALVLDTLKRGTTPFSPTCPGVVIVSSAVCDGVNIGAHCCLAFSFYMEFMLRLTESGWAGLVGVIRSDNLEFFGAEFVQYMIKNCFFASFLI